MGATNSGGVYVYDAADNVSPIHTLLNLQSSALTAALSPLQKGYIHIASNTTDRNAQAAAYSPSTTNPFLCWRADATAGQKYEYTYNGTTWFHLNTSEELAGWTNSSDGTLALNTTNFVNYDGATRPGWFRRGSTVTITGTMKPTAATVTAGLGTARAIFASTPASIQPSAKYAQYAGSVDTMGFVQQGSGNGRWYMYWNTSALTWYAVRWDNSSALSTSTWLPFNVSYEIDV